MSSPDFTVALHVGAHKTATSHLQRSVHRAADALAEAGVRYYGPEHLRLPGRSLPALFGLKAGAKQRRAPADQMALLRKGADRLVLSEENFIGVLNTPRRRAVRVRYPDAGPRISALAQAMDCGGVDVFLGIRHPATFLNSAYGQMLLGGRVMPMAQFQKLNPMSGVNWLDLVGRIRQAPGVNRLTVWRYEDHADVFGQVVGGLVGGGRADLVPPLNKRIHVGLSAAAVAAVLDSPDIEVTGQLANDARKNMPVGPEFAAFDGMSAADHAAGSQAYAAQIAGIRALDGVTFLEPPACS